MPHGIEVVDDQPVLHLRGDARALVLLAGELEKLGRSPSGSIVSIGPWRLEVSNDLDSPTHRGSLRLPWYAWLSLAVDSRSLGNLGRRSRAKTAGDAQEVRFDTFDFLVGRRRKQPVPNPTAVSHQAVVLERLGPTQRELNIDADQLHRAEQRGLPPDVLITEQDYVIELLVPWVPNRGAAQPKLWVDTSRSAATVLAYLARRRLPESLPTYAIVQFRRSWWAMLGPPGHNSFHLHPLAGRGLKSGGVYEVLNSSLYDRRLGISTPGSGQRRGRSGERGSARHFLITFLDQTFECFADDISGEFAGDLTAVFGRLAGVAERGHSGR